MELKFIDIHNFRNYRNESFEPGRGINIIYGDNGEGKTNLLESVYYLFSAVSHRTKKDKNLIKEDELFLKVKGESLFDDGFVNKQSIAYSRDKKKITVNNNIFTVDKYFSQFPVVIMYPQDIQLVSEGPGERRRFLNTAIIRHYPTYYSYLINYYRALKQRNIILKKGGAPEADISLWDSVLAEYGSKIIAERIIYINKLSLITDSFQKMFTEGGEGLSIDYRSPFNSVLTADVKEDTRKTTEKIVNDCFLEMLKKRREEELKRGFTVCGPHVEDMRIKLNGRDIKKFSSQGQQRTAAISLKMGQAELLHREKRERPLLLLDDCFSELDSKRSSMMLEIINDKKLQCMVTTYEKLSSPSAPGVCDTKFFRVKGGNIVSG